MEQMEKYYRVYAQFKEGIDQIDSHRYMTAAQTLADVGKDSHIGKVYYRVVDLDWVEAIELHPNRAVDRLSTADFVYCCYPARSIMCYAFDVEKRAKKAASKMPVC